MPQDFTAAQVLTAAQMDTLSGAVDGYATTATAAGTTTLTTASMYQQYFTGSTTQTVVMPVTSTLYVGQKWRVVNNSSGIVTVQSSGANTIYAVPAGGDVIFTCILASGTTAASWDYKNHIATAAALVGCAVFNNGDSFSYTNAATTLLPMTGELFDTNTFHDNSTNNTRITIPTGKGGVYRIHALCRLRDATATYAFISIFKNGTRVGAEGIENGDINREQMTSGYRWITDVTIHLTLAAGDYIEVAVTADAVTASYTLQAQFDATLVV